MAPPLNTNAVRPWRALARFKNMRTYFHHEMSLSSCLEAARLPNSYLFTMVCRKGYPNRDGACVLLASHTLHSTAEAFQFPRGAFGVFEGQSSPRHYRTPQLSHRVVRGLPIRFCTHKSSVLLSHLHSFLFYFALQLVLVGSLLSSGQHRCVFHWRAERFICDPLEGFH